MSLERITKHAEQAQERALAQYQGRPNFAAFLAAISQGVQKVEDGLFTLQGSDALSTAQGAQLDALGNIVGAVRLGLNDEQYRALLRGTIAQNNGDGTLEVLLTIVRGLFQTSAVFFKQPNSFSTAPKGASATVSISVGEPKVPQEVLGIVKAQLGKALGAGIALNYLGQFEKKAFAMQGTQTWVGGFGDVNNPNVGAPLGTVLLSNPSF